MQDPELQFLQPRHRNLLLGLSSCCRFCLLALLSFLEMQTRVDNKCQELAIGRIYLGILPRLSMLMPFWFQIHPGNRVIMTFRPQFTIAFGDTRSISSESDFGFLVMSSCAIHYARTVGCNNEL